MEKEIEFVPKYFTHIICRMGKVICVKTVHVVGKREYAKTICQTLSDRLGKESYVRNIFKYNVR